MQSLIARNVMKQINFCLERRLFLISNQLVLQRLVKIESLVFATNSQNVLNYSNILCKVVDSVSHSLNIAMKVQLPQRMVIKTIMKNLSPADIC